MNAERLLALYDSVADAPDGVARLRRFVLDLAVRGTLVPQNSADEPAGELLKRIASEKRRCGVDNPSVGRASARQAAPHALSSELPEGWCATTPGSYAIDVFTGPFGSMLHQSNYVVGGIPLINPSHMKDDRIECDPRISVSPAMAQHLSSYALAAGDIVMARRGEFGRAALVEPHQSGWLCGTGSFFLRSVEDVNRRYLLLLLRTTSLRSYLAGRAVGTTMVNLNHGILKSTPLQIPPIAEQQRIVTKVDELMTLCDRIEAARANREATRDRLAAASLARLNAPDPEHFTAHARFALDALPALTTRPDQVKALRQTILNLAARGRLVAQDPNDEPAAALLQSFAGEKINRRKSTGDARIKAAPDPNPRDLPMQLPTGWGAQSFENLFLYIDYRDNTPPKTDEGILLITAKNVRMGTLNREPREYISPITFKSWMTRGYPGIGDLLFTTEAPLANVCLNELREPFALAQRTICLQPYGSIDTKYCMYALMSDVMQSLIESHATGLTAKGIKAAKLKPIPIPVAPLNEQHRIVATVDELMSLCDGLEESLSSADGTRSDLLQSLLAEALAPPSKQFPLISEADLHRVGANGSDAMIAESVV